MNKIENPYAELTGGQWLKGNLHTPTTKSDGTRSREVGKRFVQTDSNAIKVQVPPEAKYVRFECWGKGESFAWTQPLFVSA